MRFKMLHFREPKIRNLPRFKLAKANEEQSVQFEFNLIKQWWTFKLFEGSQLYHREKYKQDFDYKDNGPWFKYVAVIALYQDFMNYAPHSKLTLFKFRKFLKILLGTTVISSYGKLFKKDGSLYLRPRRSYMLFKRLAYYKERQEKNDKVALR